MKRDTLGFRIGRLLLWLGMILLLLVAGVGMLLEQTLPRQNGTIRVAGTKAPVEIGRDAMGVVTVRAGSEADAAFAMGFAHAQDRLFQMDLMRRLGAGRLSEVLGAGTLDTDRFMRKLGLYRVAEANYRNLPADAQALFQAYADGVNAFLARRDSLLPAEFMALGYRPEPWRPADSIVWGRLMALWLSTNFDDEQLRQLMSTRLSPQDMQWIFPAAQRLSQREDLPGMPAMGASNNWVIAGRLTASGKPLLANDPHLGLDLPSTWYLARIEFDGPRPGRGDGAGRAGRRHRPQRPCRLGLHHGLCRYPGPLRRDPARRRPICDARRPPPPDPPAGDDPGEGRKARDHRGPVDAPWSADGCRSRPASRLCAGLDGPAAR